MRNQPAAILEWKTIVFLSPMGETLFLVSGQKEREAKTNKTKQKKKQKIRKLVSLEVKNHVIHPHFKFAETVLWEEKAIVSSLLSQIFCTSEMLLFSRNWQMKLCGTNKATGWVNLVSYLVWTALPFYWVLNLHLLKHYTCFKELKDERKKIESK